MNIILDLITHKLNENGFHAKCINNTISICYIADNIEVMFGAVWIFKDYIRWRVSNSYYESLADYRSPSSYPDQYLKLDLLDVDEFIAGIKRLSIK